jgi:hypothetical protein
MFIKYSVKTRSNGAEYLQISSLQCCSYNILLPKEKQLRQLPNSYSVVLEKPDVCLVILQRR